MNEHSKYFEKVKKYYDSSLWTKEMVYNAVTHPEGAPWITIEEAEEIVGTQEVKE